MPEWDKLRISPQPAPPSSPLNRAPCRARNARPPGSHAHRKTPRSDVSPWRRSARVTTARPAPSTPRAHGPPNNRPAPRAYPSPAETDSPKGATSTPQAPRIRSRNTRTSPPSQARFRIRPPQQIRPQQPRFRPSPEPPGPASPTQAASPLSRPPVFSTTPGGPAVEPFRQDSIHGGSPVSRTHLPPQMRPSTD